MPNTQPSLAWTPPPGWPTPPEGWAPSLGWQPEPDWPTVPANYQWWQLTQQGLRRRRTAIVLVGLWSAIGLLYGAYGIAVITAISHAIRARHSWHAPISPGSSILLTLVWLGSFAFLIPAGSIGASELLGRGKSARGRTAAFIGLLCIGVVAEYVADLQAAASRLSSFAGASWLHDGRSWLALMSLFAILVFAGTTRLLKPAGPRHSASTA